MIPNLFRPLPLPKEIPAVLVNYIEDFSKTSKTDKEFIEKCFFLLVSFQKGKRRELFLHPHRLFWVDLNFLFQFRGYFHCTTINYLLRAMLVKSGRFNEKDIQQIPASTWLIFPHQYLKINLKNNIYLNLDPWAYRFGINFGDFAHGFHSGKFFPIR